MSEETSSLTSMRIANTPNAFDLRKVGAHPDYWYPVAWCDELKAGKTLGRRFAGEPIVLYRGQSGQVFALEDRCAHRQVPLHLGVVCGEELKCHYHGWSYGSTGKCVSVPYLGKERLPNGVKSYPVRELDGLIFVFPGDPALAESRLPKTLGASPTQGLQDAPAEPRSGVPLHLHARESVRHEPSVHAPQADGLDPRQLPRAQARRGLGAGRVQLQPHRRASSSVGEQVIVDLMRKRTEAKKDFSDHMRIRTDYPTQSLKVWVGRNIQDTDDPVLEVWLGYTPLDAQQRTNRTFGYLSVKKPKFPGVSTPFGRSWCGSPRTSSARTRKSWSSSSGRTTRRAQTGTTRCFPPIRDLRGVLARCGKPME